MGGAALAAVLLLTAPAAAGPFHFSTGSPDGLIATATRPSSAGKFEIESADDFILGGATSINHATFTGLLTDPTFMHGISPSQVSSVKIEIYEVFPNLSNVGRTSGPPTFSTNKVPTRVKSPSDVELDDRNSQTGTLQYATIVLNPRFTALNSVLPGGIHAKPNQHTGGNGPVTGTEVTFDVNFGLPFVLPAGHFFFVPQVQVNGGEFLWLSAPFPNSQLNPDLQTWTRDQALQPDWLRVGTDIVGGTKFNASFSLDGFSPPIPEPATLGLVAAGLVGFSVAHRWRRPAPATAGK
jgi:hypothetical protein